MFVQAGRDCSMAQQEATGRYTFRATIEKETIVFSERPDRTSGTVPTQAFVEQFHELFATSNPNTAITIAGDNGGPLICCAFPTPFGRR